MARFRNPFSGPSRPRAIIWTSVGLFVIAGIAVIAMFWATSTKWFCATPCHSVQADTIAAYDASSHSKISCLACHEPVGAGPHILVLAKAKSALEVLTTLTGAYDLPLNAGSAYGLGEEMKDEQCTQCHGTNRKITATKGVIIDHAVHTKNGVTCVTCHNRVAHNEENLTFTLAGNAKHADFEKMDACFRCHDIQNEGRAPGKCSTCHPTGFDLVPATHKSQEWMPAGHAEAAKEALKEYGKAELEAKKLVLEGIDKSLATPVEHCSTCHTRAFCKACHSKLGKVLEQAQKK